MLARDYSALEIELITQEEKVKKQRMLFDNIITDLQSLKIPDVSNFTIHTYDGVEGFKQMQWNELQTKKEILVLGNVRVEDLVEDRRWAEKFRARTVSLGYTMRELINRTYKNPLFTENQEFFHNTYSGRIISKDILPIDTPIIIYNDTVAIYQYLHEQKVGIEIINRAFANTMRHIFEHYWNLAKTK